MALDVGAARADGQTDRAAARRAEAGPAPEPAPRRYDAFISYSHAADGKLAPALQSALHRLAKPWYRRRALHVFRDQTSLAATPTLWPTICEALAASGHFLLLASPEAAQSHWVQQEVEWWLEHRSPQTLFIVLTDGTLAWDDGAGDFDWARTDALPMAIKGAFNTEPLWVDLRWAKQETQVSQKDPRFQDAIATLAAPLHGRSKEDLFGEDVRQHRRSMDLARGAIAILIVLTLISATLAGVAWWQRTEALNQQARAERRFNDVLQLANSLLFEFDTSIAHLAGSTPARKFLAERALTYLDGLALEADSNPQIQRSLGVGYDNVGRIQSATGDTLSAQASFDHALAIAEQLAQDSPTDFEARRDLELSLHKVGGIQQAMGDTAGAQASFDRALDIAERLAQEYPTDIQAQRDLANSHELAGGARRGNLHPGDEDDVRSAMQAAFEPALANYQRALAIREQLARDNPTDVQAQRDLARSVEQIGTAQLAADGDAALASYQRALAIRERLAQADPINALLQDDLARSYQYIGNAQVLTDDTDSGLANYQRALAIHQRLAQADPTSTSAQSSLAISYGLIGSAQLLAGDTDSGLASHRQRLAIREKLVQDDPTDVTAKRDLVDVHEQIAWVQMTFMDDTAGALASYQRALAIRERLARTAPPDAQAQRDLAYSYARVGTIQQASGDTTAALTSYGQALANFERLAQADPKNVATLRSLGLIRDRVADLERMIGGR